MTTKCEPLCPNSTSESSKNCKSKEKIKRLAERCQNNLDERKRNGVIIPRSTSKDGKIIELDKVERIRTIVERCKKFLEAGKSRGIVVRTKDCW